MGCRCNERKAQLGTAIAAVRRGDLRTAASNVQAASRTLAADTRSGALAREAMARAAAFTRKR